MYDNRFNSQSSGPGGINVSALTSDSLTDGQIRRIQSNMQEIAKRVEKHLPAYVHVEGAVGETQQDGIMGLVIAQPPAGYAIQASYQPIMDHFDEDNLVDEEEMEDMAMQIVAGVFQGAQQTQNPEEEMPAS